MKGEAVIQAGFLVVATILGCLADLAIDFNFRDRVQMIDGKNAEPGNFPWHVAIFWERYIFCGGSVIHRQWVLSAAHCFLGKTQVDVVFGYLRLKRKPRTGIVRSAKIIIHEDYDESSNNDIALVLLSKHLLWSDKLRPVKLPSRSQSSAPSYGETVTISGWENTALESYDSADTLARTLQFAETKIMGDNNCDETTSICTKSAFVHEEGADYGGNPLVWRDNGGIVRQYGILSEGDAFTTETKTEEVTHIDRFTKVHHYLDWIEAKTGIDIAI